MSERDDALTAIEKAERTVDALCAGKLRWEMRVPAEPDHDPDLVISDALAKAKRALELSATPASPAAALDVERQLLEATAVRQAILELQRERGRLSRVTVGEYMIVLGAVRQLSTEALTERLSETPADRPQK